MASSSLHPTDQALQAYRRGDVDELSADSIGSHLEECPDCRRRAGTFPSTGVQGGPRGVASTRGASTARSEIGGDRGRSVPGAPSSGGIAAPELADLLDYEVRRELGRGGMGVVYLAHNQLMGRDEVLKVVSRHLLDRRGVLDRFLREIRSAARLHHPNIVTAYSAFRSGEHIVFGMEYVEGLDLARLVKAKGPLPVAHACSFVQQAALGLQHAHEQGMVHRDIKPGNLMLSRKGDKAIVKVLDFGLAKATREDPLDSGLTHEGQMLGTPDYIAPEQSRNAQKADIRADIYSLGCTLYYLLTGRPPFQGTSLYDLLQAHHSMDAQALDLVRPDVPFELAALVAKMMAKDPDHRFQTPGEVAKALAPFKAAKPTSAAPVIQPAPTGMTRAPSPPEPAAGPAPVKASGRPEVAWDSLIDIRDDEPSPSPDAAPAVSDPARPRPPWAWAALAAGVLICGLIVAWGAGAFRTEAPKAAIARDGDRAPLPLRPEPKPLVQQETGPSPLPVAMIRGGAWSIEGEELIQSSDRAGGIVFGDPAWSEYDLTLDARKDLGSGHGLQVIFHRTDPESYCWYGLGVFENKGSEMYFRLHGKGSRGGDGHADNWAWKGIDRGVWYSIKIKVRKSHFQCYLDDKLVFDESSSPFTHGQIGLGTGRIRARFRRLRVTTPGGETLCDRWPQLVPGEEEAAPVDVADATIPARPGPEAGRVGSGRPIKKLPAPSTPAAEPSRPAIVDVRRIEGGIGPLKIDAAPTGEFWPLLTPGNTRSWRVADPGSFGVNDAGVVLEAGPGGNFLLTTRASYKKCSINVHLAATAGTEAYLVLRASEGPEGWRGITARIADEGGKIHAWPQSTDFAATAPTLPKGSSLPSFPPRKDFHVKFNVDDNNRSRVLINGKPITTVNQEAKGETDRAGAVGFFIKSGTLVVHGVRVEE